MKHKKTGAEKALKAIEEFKKLSEEIKKGLENDKNSHISKIIELERLCASRSSSKK